MLSKQKKTEDTFQHIREYWKEEEYRKCLFEWKQIQPFISKEATKYQCCGCDTFWTSVLINLIFIENQIKMKKR